MHAIKQSIVELYAVLTLKKERGTAMKHRINHLLLALVFGLFAFYAVALSPGALAIVDYVALFFFGLCSGIQLHMFWITRPDSHSELMRTNLDH